MGILIFIRILPSKIANTENLLPYSKTTKLKQVQTTLFQSLSECYVGNKAKECP